MRNAGREFADGRQALGPEQGSALGVELGVTPRQRSGKQRPPELAFSNYAGLSRDLAVGQRVFVDDGKILLKVIEQQGDRNVCRVLQGGVFDN